MFVNPFTMFLGGALISSPIIIHLINRIRYKRIRWAAMEFLLKSQKRSRRKLIVEQLILLLLRVLMVLLIALLLARFLGFTAVKASEEKYTSNIIILDDTPSMADISRGADGKTSVAFEQAKHAILKITKELSSAPTPQYIQIVRLSELNDPKGNLGQLKDGSVSPYLKSLKAGSTHVDLIKGLEVTDRIFNTEKEVKKNLYVISDFRNNDWNPTQELRLQKKFADLKDAKIQVILFDVAAPERSKTETQKPPLHSDNLAITDFRPASSMAVDGAQTEFTLAVTNYSANEKTAEVTIRVNGTDIFAAKQNIAHLAPHQTVTVRFPLTLTLPKTDDVPKQALETAAWQLKRFYVVTAKIQRNEETEPGLGIDDRRYTVVEVRKQIPILLVDNATAQHKNKGSESFFIFKVFGDTLKQYDVKIVTAAQLDKMNLQPFASVMLCNIPKLNEAARKNLEGYVANGRGVAFFMGPAITETDVKFYNETLYNAGKGLFPVPLELKPKNAGLSEKELSDLTLSMRLTKADQLLIRKENRSHPALVKLFDEARLLRDGADDDFGGLTRYQAFAQYFILNRRGLINDGQEKLVDTLMYLPNFGGSLNGASVESQQRDRDLFNKSLELLKKLPIRENFEKNPEQMKLVEKFAKYAEQLEALNKKAKDAISEPKTKLPDLAEVLKLFVEPRIEGPDRPDLRTLWKDPEMAELYKEFKLLWERMRYGDPIYVSRTYGKGRVVAWLGSAGTSWNPSDTGYFVPFMRDSVQAYLGSSGTDLNLTLKTPYPFTLDPLHYATSANKWFVQEKTALAKENQAQAQLETVPESRDAQVLNAIVETGESKPKALSLVFTEGNEPGVYLFEFTEQRANPNGQIDKISDFRALSYNFDTSTESDLSRAITSDLLRIGSVDEVYTMSSSGLNSVLNTRPSDLSEKSWLYLILLFVLIAEQAMAVRLSFHARPAEESKTPTPVLTGRGVVTA